MLTERRGLAPVGIFAGLLALLPAPSLAIVFQDGDFDLANYDVVTFSTRLLMIAGDVTFDYNRELVGGNPGAFMKLRVTAPPPTQPGTGIGVFLWKQAYDPDPSDPTRPAIGTLDFAGDDKCLAPDGNGQCHSTGLVVEQEGDYWTYRVSPDENLVWLRSTKRGILATDLSRIGHCDDPSHLCPNGGAIIRPQPDFSVNAPPLRFGFYTARNGGFAVDHGRDNWLVRVNATCAVDAECDDADPCTADACVGGACAATDRPGCGFTLTKDDHDHSVSDGPVIPYEITITNDDPVTKPAVRLVDVVPIQTTFQPAAPSTPGWSCPDGPEEGKLCTFDLGDLGPGETRTLTFTALVGPAPTSWDIYNEVGVLVGAAAAADGVLATSRMPRGGNLLTYRACLLLGVTTTTCAFECSDALNSACWSEYRKFIDGTPGVTRQTLALVCCLANLAVRTECSLQTYNCGDGVQQPREECDDGNPVDGDGCDNNCKATGCGNFVPTAGEACDDGPNGTPCCTAACTVPASAPPTCFPPSGALHAARPAARGAAPPPNPIDLRLLYTLRDGVFRTTVGGRRAIELYYLQAPDLVRAALEAPELLDLARSALGAWAPSLAALATEGAAAVSSAQIATLNDFLATLEPLASRSLRGALERGRKRLQVDTWPGLSIAEAFSRLDRFVCATEATYASVGCRIDDLLAVFDTDLEPGRYPDRLVKLLRKAAGKAARAEQLSGEGKRRPARSALRAVGRRLKACDKAVRSRRGQRELPEAARAQLLALLGPLLGDVKTLRRQ